MIVTPSGLSREFYNQTGTFEIETSFTANSSSVPYCLKISGDSGVAKITLNNGKFLDNQDRFVYGYRAGDSVNFKVNCNQYRYDLYVNGSPIVFGGIKFSGKSNWFIFETEEEVSDFSYSIKGYTPNYSYSNNLVFDTQISTLTGSFNNLDTELIKIYSGRFDGDTGTFNVSWPASNINSMGSGMYIITVNKTGLGGPSLLENTVFTNFGEIKININVSGQLPAVSPYIFNLMGPNLVEVDFDAIYYGNFTSNAGYIEVVPLLQHVQGSGDTYIDIGISGFYQSNFTGYLTEYGILYSPIQLTGSGQGGGLDLVAYGDISGIEQISSWATGFLSGDIYITGTGFISTTGYTGLVYGAISSYLTGTVNQGSGSLYFNEEVVKTVSTVYTLNPISFTPSTGAIYYNTPMNSVTSDILYINSYNHGIIYGFHHNNIDELVTYINSNTGIHGVTGFKTTSNIIELGSILAYTDQPILLEVDYDNDGSMAVSSGYMAGGAIIGLGSGINVPTLITGRFNGNIKNSGLYSVASSGYATGTAPVLDRSRIFSEIWDLSSGQNYFEMTSYVDNGYIGESGLVSPYYLKTEFMNSIYLRVNYKDSVSDVVDIVRLLLSGIGSAEGYYAEILITGDKT